MGSGELYPGETSATEGLKRDIRAVETEMRDRSIRQPRNGFDYRAEIDRFGDFSGFSCLRCPCTIIAINQNIIRAKRDYYFHWLREHADQREVKDGLSTATSAPGD